MPVATPVQPNRAVDSGAQYPANIDAAIAALAQLGWRFAPHEQATPNMTVRLDAGTLFTATAATVIAAQSTGTITAPVGNPRIDRVVIDAVTGAVAVITGTPAGSPSAPAITAGKLPVCQVLLQTTSTSITNSMLTDERSPVLAINNYLWSGAALAVANGGTGATTAVAAADALGAARSLDRDVTATTVTNTTTETTVYSYSVPANTLGTNRALRLTLIGQFVRWDLSPDTLTIKVKFGATVIATFAVSSAVGNKPGYLNLLTNLSALNATNAQVAQSQLTAYRSAADTVDGTTANTPTENLESVHLSVAEDSTVAKTLSVTFQYDAALTTLSAKCLTAQLELL